MKEFGEEKSSDNRDTMRLEEFLRDILEDEEKKKKEKEDLSKG